MKTKISISIIITLAIATIFMLNNKNIYPHLENKGVKENTPNKDTQAFLNSGLKTDTSKSSIPIDQILGGGPAKDGIPAINNPKFENIEKASKWLRDNSLGILYESNGVKRYYPYAILYWHEIVNDTVGDSNVSITFCPLCGTAIVFNRELSGETLQFGVSGKLYQSNLLMYDTKTESLWSQARAKAVVGELTGSKLEILGGNTLTFKEVREKHPEAEILSRETGFNRNYGKSPYGNYELNETLYFPTDNFDDDFPPKEIFYVVNVSDKLSIGFNWKSLLKKRVLKNENYITTINEEGVVKTKDRQGKSYNGYMSMYFSWQVQDDRKKITLK